MATPILDSWAANAAAWDAALINGELRTRTLVTNQAIVNAIVALQPQRVLDAGCGEGWLCRALQESGIITYGTDATQELISLAKQKDSIGQYDCISFEDIADGLLIFKHLYDCVVINFSLYEEALTSRLLKALTKTVHSEGYLAIQTLHPCFYLPKEMPYQPQWIEESWAGMKRNFSHPYCWYFRTMENWMAMLAETGWRMQQLIEPVNPETLRPASAIFISQKNE